MQFQKLRKTHHAESPRKSGEIEYFDPKKATRRNAARLCLILRNGDYAADEFGGEYFVSDWQLKAVQMNTVIQHISAAFMLARSSYPELRKTWRDISFRIGGLLPNSTLLPSVHRAGDLDMLLRAIEDEFGSVSVEPENADPFSCHYQLMLSEIWVGEFYEIFRLLKERELAQGDCFNALAHDLRLLRIPLEKHEIVADAKLRSPLLMQTYPPDNGKSKRTTYDKDDPQRAHIMPSGISERGSTMWLAIDHRGNKQFWLERRALSERIVALWQSLAAA